MTSKCEDTKDVAYIEFESEFDPQFENVDISYTVMANGDMVLKLEDEPKIEECIGETNSAEFCVQSNGVDQQRFSTFEVLPLVPIPQEIAVKATKMSVVQDIKKLQESNSLNMENRLTFKASGRPVPTLDITQTSLDRKKEVRRYFRKNMYEVSEWICGCDTVNAFFCFPCLLFSNDDFLWCKHGIKDLKHLKEKVQAHSLLASHMKNSMCLGTMGHMDIRQQLDSSYRQNIKVYNENVSRNRHILNIIIDCVKFCGKFGLALRGHDETEDSENPGVFLGLIDFAGELDCIFNEHLNKSTVFKDISKTIQNELLDSILIVAQNEIKSEIERCDYLAVQIDEITDSSNKTQVVFIFRYVLDGVIRERFWKFLIAPGTTSLQLSSLIFNEFKILGIDETPEKLIAQSYDAASVMSGRFGGVQAKIKEIYPAANFIHCYAHQLNLILQKATNQNKPIKLFFANLQSFSSFFGKSSKRTAILDKIVQARLPRPITTRWLFNNRCVESVYVYKDDIAICLDIILDTENDSSTINEAVGLQNYLKSEEFLYWLNFFHTLMPHCEILFDQLQRKNIDAVSVKKFIADFKSSVKKVRDSDMVLDSCYVVPGLSAPKRVRKEKGPSRLQMALEVCDIVLLEIQERFRFINHLILAKLFYSDKFSDYKTNFPDDILKIVKNSYPFVNYNKLKTELEVIYDREDFYYCEGSIPLLQLFINSNLCDTFSETVKMLKVLCTLPMTTVESERCFSTLKRIKTFLRNTIGQERLCSLGMLTIEKTFIKDIPNFNKLVIQHFAEAKDRGVDLKYKKF